MDLLAFGYGFDIKDYHWQASLVHECTHAHLDIQSFGAHSLVDYETVAHIAEAVFLEAIHRQARDSQSPVWLTSQDIAKRILNGTYSLTNDDVSPLVAELQKVPAYRNQMIDSNGFNRSVGDKIWRHV